MLDRSECVGLKTRRLNWWTDLLARASPNFRCFIASFLASDHIGRGCNLCRARAPASCHRFPLPSFRSLTLFLYSRLRSPCPHARRPRPRPVPSLTYSPRRSPILHLLITIHAINALRSSPNLGVHNKQEAAAGLKHSEHAAPPSRRWAFLFIHSASDSCAPSLTNPGRASLLS